LAVANNHNDTTRNIDSIIYRIVFHCCLPIVLKT
jgi:hypothetical protein